jgi:hypothetical protein
MNPTITTNRQNKTASRNLAKSGCKPTGLTILGTATLEQVIVAGYGVCGYPGGCPCRGYSERYDGSNICGNCFHHYSHHW